MSKAFPRFASLGCLVLWLSSFSVAQCESANITIRCAAGIPTGSFSVCMVLHKVAGAILKRILSAANVCIKLGILTLSS